MSTYYVFSLTTKVMIGTVKAENDDRAITFAIYSYGRGIYIQNGYGSIVGEFGR